ncbi:MAG: hypothetical protein LIO46_02530 [Clostridiales bacterium]|nr:hypothetical protein [Clostridiales bacterium]
MAGAGVLMWRRLWDGAQVFTGYFTPDLSRVVSLSFLEPIVPDAAQAWNCALLCIFGLVPYTGLLVWLVVRRRTGLGALAAAAPVLGFVYTLKGAPDRGRLVMQRGFFLTWLIQPRGGKEENEKTGKGSRGRPRHTHGYGAFCRGAVPAADGGAPGGIRGVAQNLCHPG